MYGILLCMSYYWLSYYWYHYECHITDWVAKSLQSVVVVAIVPNELYSDAENSSRYFACIQIDITSATMPHHWYLNILSLYCVKYKLKHQHIVAFVPLSADVYCAMWIQEGSTMNSPE